MPLYRCIVAPNASSYAARAAIAEHVTRIHCDVTGGVPLFVHVFFTEDAAGMLPTDKRALMLGSIRAGRTPEQKARLVAAMEAVLAEHLRVVPAAVSVVTVDVPARWVMEGGDVLPEPGDETAWLAKHGA